MSIQVVEEKCVGCSACVRACPFGAIDMVDKIAVINEKCTVCGACVDACKFDAIVMRIKHFERKDISAYKGVFVFCEQKNGKLQTIAYEMLGDISNAEKDYRLALQYNPQHEPSRIALQRVLQNKSK